MDEKIVFLDIVIFLTFLTMILSYMFFYGLIDIYIIFALLLVYVPTYAFFYKVRIFQKILFILSICFFIALMVIYPSVLFDNVYNPFIIILNWYFIWLIFKDSGIFNEIIGKSQTGLALFILYLVFNLIFVFSPNNAFDLFIITVVPLEIGFSHFLLATSIILSIIFVATMMYNRKSSLDLVIN